MLFNKEIIIRIVVGIAFFAIFFRVIGPSIMAMFKGKIPGAYNPDSDIDSMIRSQKEKLRAQYGITQRESTSANESSSPPATKEIEALYKETRWGGGEFAKTIQSDISKNYSYTLAETKVNSFVLLAEKRNYLRFLSPDNQKSPEAIKNFLSLVLLNLLLVDEIRSKEFNLLERVAKKCKVSSQEFMLALQLKIFSAISSKKEIKEERIFVDTPALHQFSEDTIKEAFDTILKKEANLWAKGHSVFFEELALYLSYAELLIPYPKLQHKNDLETAYRILKVGAESETEDIKRIYKKLAMTRHPDKIGQMKLPKILEKKAIAKFNSIQEAYDLILSQRKK